MFNRILSSLLGFPLVFLVLVFGNKYVIDIAFCIIGIMTIHEFMHAFSAKAKPIKYISYLSCLWIGLVHVVPQDILIFAIPILVFVLFMHVICTKLETSIIDLSITLFGIMYVVGFTIFIPILHGIENGKIYIWYLMFAAWGTDISAFIVGKAFGKHKLCELSPKKTIEGSIGGILGSLLFVVPYTIFVNNYFGLNISYLYIIIIGILLSVLGQVGDIAASSVKRYAGIKDFGSLIPGHGGMLDRIDSIIFIAPFAYLFLGGILF